MIRPTVQTVVTLLVVFSSGCAIFEEKRGIWEDLNFPMQSAYSLFLDGDDLYVAAGYDGLWVLDLSGKNREWEYLGHRVTEGERHFESGVQAIDVYRGKITIGYADPTLQEDGHRIGMWCSKYRGGNWEPCDNGARQLLGGEPWSSARSIIRSPHNHDHILSGDGSIYKSTDNGEEWDRVYPEPEFPFRFTSVMFYN